MSILGIILKWQVDEIGFVGDNISEIMLEAEIEVFEGLKVNELNGLGLFTENVAVHVMYELDWKAETIANTVIVMLKDLELDGFLAFSKERT